MAFTKNQKRITAGLIVILACAASFYGGTLYAKHAAVTARGTFSAGAVARGAMQGAGTLRVFGGVSGEVLSIADGIMTVKLGSGGSTIVHYTQATPVMTTASSSLSAITAGSFVTVSGATATDGSVSADSIRLGGPAGR